MSKHSRKTIRKGKARVKNGTNQPWPKVRPRTMRMKGRKYTYWVVDSGVLEGKRRIENFKTRREADVRAESIRLEQRQIGFDAVRLKEDDKRDAVRALRLLEGCTTLEQASRFFMIHHGPTTQKRTVAEAYDEFITSKRHSGLSAMTLKSYAWKVGRFAREFADRVLTSITPGEIEAWMNMHDFKGQNRADYRRHLAILYRFAIARKYAVDNVAAAVSKVTVARRIPSVLTAEEVRTLLLTASAYSLGRMLPYFAIGCFCGLRPWELRKMSWAEINFETKEIYISPDVAKTGQDRFVSVPDNLIHWLSLVPEGMRKGTVFFSRREFNTIRREAGLLDKWAIDVMRHSAASHLYAATQSAAQVTAQMGHGLSVFMRHYRKAVSKREGDAYFRVTPIGTETNALQMTPPAEMDRQIQ